MTTRQYIAALTAIICGTFALWLVTLVGGCVTVNKETNVFVIDPVIQVEVEVK